MTKRYYSECFRMLCNIEGLNDLPDHLIDVYYSGMIGGSVYHISKQDKLSAIHRELCFNYTEIHLLHM